MPTGHQSDDHLLNNCLLADNYLAEFCGNALTGVFDFTENLGFVRFAHIGYKQGLVLKKAVGQKTADSHKFQYTKRLCIRFLNANETCK